MGAKAISQGWLTVDCLRRGTVANGGVEGARLLLIDAKGIWHKGSAAIEHPPLLNGERRPYAAVKQHMVSVRAVEAALRDSGVAVRVCVKEMGGRGREAEL